MSTENTITTAEKDFAAAPNATLDELVGTTTVSYTHLRAHET